MVSRTEQLALMNRLGSIALKAVQDATPTYRFGRLKKGFRKIVRTDRVTIYSIYYWTRIVNDGRGEVHAKAGGPPLIYFKDPRKDPRIQGNYPRGRNQIRRLTRQQFVQNRRLGNLIITRKVGEALPERFLEKGLQDARKLVPVEVRKRILSDVRRNLRRARDSVTIRL